MFRIRLELEQTVVDVSSCLFLLDKEWHTPAPKDFDAFGLPLNGRPLSLDVYGIPGVLATICSVLEVRGRHYSSSNLNLIGVAKQKYMYMASRDTNSKEDLHII